MKSEIKKPNISSIFPMLTFIVLAACIVLVLIMGARLYKRSNERDEADYYHRTVTSYVSTRVSQSAVEGRFFVGDFYEGKPSEKGNTLFFTEELGGELYVTRLYCHDGGLYELFSPASADLDPEAGERVLPLESIDFTIEGGLLLADIVFDDGESLTLRMSLRVGGAQIEK
jgi:hypothetical protein